MTPDPVRSPRGRLALLALLCALNGAAAALRADLPSGRSVEAPAGAAVPTPPGSGAGDAQDELLRAQARRLSRVARSLDRASAALAAQDRAQADLQVDLAGLRERVARLEAHALALDESQSAAAVSDAALGAQQQSLNAGLSGLKARMDRQSRSIAAGLREMGTVRASLERLDRMDELVAMVKSDMEADDLELARVKQTLRRLQSKPESETSWWRKVLDYRYLPAVAVGISVVALGVAAAHR